MSSSGRQPRRAPVGPGAGPDGSTVPATPPGRPQEPCHTPPDGALLRFELPAGAWAEGIPPAPSGVTPTVVFSSDQAEAEHGEALRLLGYLVVGVAPLADPTGHPERAVGGPGPDVAEMLVPRAVLERHATWFRSLLSQSSRAFDLSAGPVLVALRARWRLHRCGPPSDAAEVGSPAR